MALASAADVKARAQSLGFNLCGITPARPAPHLDAYLRWVDQGLHGTLAYMARPDRVARRRDLNQILPGAQSLILVALDHHQTSLPPEVALDPARGRIAMYAWGSDYHTLMLQRLKALADELRADRGGELRWRAYVDTGAVLERDHAQQAGLGFIGKNTLLIHPRRGSGFFLGEILVDAVFDRYDEPGPETRCGTCTRCLNACPTAAFPEPYVLDARRCISYLTIEHKGYIDPALRPRMGRWIFGCDICQAVCPWNRFGVATLEPTLQLEALERAAPLLADVLALDEAGFSQRYAGTPLERVGRDRLMRNACVAAGNSGVPALEPLLRERLADTSPLVRAHAAWALAQQGRDAISLIRAARDGEIDAEARADLAQTLQDAEKAAH
jgi:epoxyqueuosine reductase